MQFPKFKSTYCYYSNFVHKGFCSEEQKRKNFILFSKKNKNKGNDITDQSNNLNVNKVNSSYRLQQEYLKKNLPTPGSQNQPGTINKENSILIQALKDIKQTTFSFIGIKSIKKVLLNFIQTTCGNFTVIHTINYLNVTFTQNLYPVLGISSDIEYLEYISSTFMNMLLRRSNALNIKENKIRYPLSRVIQNSMWYYVLNYFYLSSDINAFNNFKHENFLTSVKLPLFFVDIISQFKVKKHRPNYSDKNIVIHIFDNLHATKFIKLLRDHVNYSTNNYTYTDDFGDQYHHFIELLSNLGVEMVELSPYLTTNRYVHTGLFAHNGFIGCDYEVELKEYLYNLVFLKKVDVTNDEYSTIRNPLEVTLNRDECEYHTTLHSFNITIENFIYSMLGVIPPSSGSPTSEESIDFYEVTNSSDLQSFRNMRQGFISKHTNLNDVDEPKENVLETKTLDPNDVEDDQNDEPDNPENKEGLDESS